MEALLPIIIQLISGGVGGNIVGGLLKNLSLGTTGNTVAGGIGGLIGGYLTQILGAGGAEAVANAAAASGLDLGSLISQVAGGGVGGLILTAIIGAIKNSMART